MALTPNSVRVDLKCGKGAISKGEKCTKGTARNVTAGLNKATTAQLRSHSNMLQNDLIVKYGGMNKASSNFEAFKKWAVGQKEYKELRAVQSILSKRNDALDHRFDLKCGKGAISKGEKCTKGTPTEAKKPTSKTEMASKALMVGGGIAAVAGAAYGFKKFKSMKGRVSSFNKRAAAGDKTANTPDAKQAVMNQVFKEGRQLVTGAQVAGAGLSLAGAGLAAYGVENKNQGAIAGGATLAYLGSSTAIGGFGGRRKLQEQQTTINRQLKQEREAYNEARQAAQARERANQASGSRGSRNVGANKAVKDPFKDLGLSERASDSDIKKQWLKLMRANHPDAGGDPRKAQQINAAYQEILRRRGKLDSIYADGFDFDLEVLGL